LHFCRTGAPDDGGGFLLLSPKVNSQTNTSFCCQEMNGPIELIYIIDVHDPLRTLPAVLGKFSEEVISLEAMFINRAFTLEKDANWITFTRFSGSYERAAFDSNQSGLRLQGSCYFSYGASASEGWQ
jgi:hypothetical protein